ncbi:MAG: hypothetical protein U9N04_03050 [Patescibacteria group bacterium]|nr:hypothetical protein [Patescibacteria group bacterium]
MKKIKLKFNKDSVKKYAVYFIKHRKFFFVSFFCALFIFAFNVIYENVYSNMENIDYVESRNFEDDEIKMREMFEKAAKNIKSRERIIQNIKNREHRNIFIFNDGKDFDEDDNNDEENNNERNGDSIILPTDSPILRAY